MHIITQISKFFARFCGFLTFSALSIPFLKEIAPMSLFSRIGSAGKNDYYVRKCKARKDRSLTKRHSNESQKSAKCASVNEKLEAEVFVWYLFGLVTRTEQ